MTSFSRVKHSAHFHIAGEIGVQRWASRTTGDHRYFVEKPYDAVLMALDIRLTLTLRDELLFWNAMVETGKQIRYALEKDEELRDALTAVCLLNDPTVYSGAYEVIAFLLTAEEHGRIANLQHLHKAAGT